MRTFDYRQLPRQLFEGTVGEAVTRVHEDKGKLELLENMHADELALLRDRAHFDNVDASTRIEGLYVDTVRVHEVLAGAEPLGETESQIVGYSNALSLIEDNLEELGLSTATILQLYETLYGYRDLGRKSRYRKKDYMYVQLDGHLQAMPVSPITAFETPLVLGGACDGLAEAFNTGACSPLVMGAAFTVDFLCIRPFDEGNGRISRLFARLLLEKAGFRVARYESIDRIIERSAMAYYDALNSCVDGWDRAANDYVPFALYWLEVIHEAYESLFEKVEMRIGSGSKSERVRLYVKQADGAVTKRQIRETFPDVSEATVENALGAMVKADEVEKLGAGRSTSYRWKR